MSCHVLETRGGDQIFPVVQTSAIPLDKRGRPIDSAVFPKVVVRCALNRMLLDPVSRVTGIPGCYWILGIKCSDITGVRIVY